MNSREDYQATSDKMWSNIEKNIERLGAKIIPDIDALVLHLAKYNDFLDKEMKTVGTEDVERKINDIVFCKQVNAKFILTLNEEKVKLIKKNKPIIAEMVH